MDWLMFIASLVSSLAWPGVAVAFILMFRRQVRDLIGRLVEAEGFGFMGKFDRTATAVAKAAAETLAQAGTASGTGQAFDATVVVHESLSSTLGNLATENPSDAIMTAWVEIEKAIRERIGGLGTRQPTIAGMMLVRIAYERGEISEATLQAVQGLEVLRNLAAHGRSNEVDAEKAQEYLSLADATLYAIRTWHLKTG
jgi:hypothetical protein